MKSMYLILIVLLALTGCNCQKQVLDENATTKTSLTDQNKLPLLEYEANTRGFFQKITIENKTLTVSSDRNNPNKGITSTISDADAKELLTVFQKVNLKELPSYKDPTQKRFYDGAAIANLKVTLNNESYKTVDFDHEFPPVEIEKLVNKIVSFVKKSNED